MKLDESGPRPADTGAAQNLFAYSDDRRGASAMQANAPTASVDRDTAECRRLRAFALLGAHRERYIVAARRALLTAVLKHGRGTADDARRGLMLPPGVDPRFLGCVPGDLVALGIIRAGDVVRSARADSHGRWLQDWLLADRAAAERWLRDHPAPREEIGEPAAPRTADRDTR